MAFTKPETGLVINYSFLWPHEADKGREEGRKDRPCAVIVVTEDDDVYVVPITHSEPSSERGAIELPLATKQRLGLDEKPSWIITDSLNSFKWPGPDIRLLPNGDIAYGFLPHALTQQIRDKVTAHYKARSGRKIKRDE